MTATRAAWLAAEMSPKPTVAKTVTVKYMESVRVSVSTLKLSALDCSIMKYVAAKRTRKIGTVIAERLDRPNG